MNLEHKKRFIPKDLSKTISYTTLNQLKTIVKLLIIRDCGDKTICLTKKEVKNLFEVNGGKSATLLHHTISNLLKESQITLFPSKTNPNTRIIQIINSATIFENGDVEVVFNDDFIDYIDNIKDNFGTIYYEDINNIQKSHALKLYLILCAYTGNNNLYKFTVKYNVIRLWFFDDFKKDNGRTAYDRGEFKRSLIEPMIKEISLKTSISVWVEYKSEQMNFTIKREKHINNWCNDIRELDNISMYNQATFINKLRKTTEYLIGNLFIKLEQIPEIILSEYTVVLANEISTYLDSVGSKNREGYFNYILDHIDDIRESKKWSDKLYDMMMTNMSLASFISKIK